MEKSEGDGPRSRPHHAWLDRPRKERCIGATTSMIPPHDLVLPPPPPCRAAPGDEQADHRDAKKRTGERSPVHLVVLQRYAISLLLIGRMAVSEEARRGRAKRRYRTASPATTHLHPACGQGEVSVRRDIGAGRVPAPPRAQPQSMILRRNAGFSAAWRLTSRCSSGWGCSSGFCASS